MTDLRSAKTYAYTIIRPTRRATILASLATAVTMTAIALYSLPAAAQKAKGEISVEELMKPGELKELKIGIPEAPITIVEYASMTCGHCAKFHTDVLPDLKKKYIDTGKVQFIMREFPLDNLAAAASMLARCSGDNKTFPLISVLFKKQKDWAFVRGASPIPPLFEIAKQAGFTRERFDGCLKNDKLLKQVIKTRERAAGVFGVTSTPTFFVNGKRLKGGQDIKQFEEMIDPMLAEKK